MTTRNGRPNGGNPAGASDIEAGGGRTAEEVVGLLEAAAEEGGPRSSGVLADKVFGPPQPHQTPLYGAPAPLASLAAASRRSTWPTFARVATCHVACVWPQVRREMTQWSGRAARIPARGLREAAAEAARKRGNIEGAALFATGAPKGHREAAIRAIVAFQSAYNYVDALSEREDSGGAPSAEQLHQALLMALHESAEEPDYYEAYEGDDDDGGYLTALVRECRQATAQLPAFEEVAPMARDAAARIVDFQTLNRRESEGGHGALRAWSTELRRAQGGDLAWWELAAGAGSSLGVHALIGAAADPVLDVYDARGIGRVYFPAGGGLHSMLDSLVDREEDARAGFRSLLDYYSSSAQVALRLGVIAREATDATDRLSRDGEEHRVIMIAMCSYYLSASESNPQERDTVAGILKGVFGEELDVAIAMFRAKRWLHTHVGTVFT